MLRYLIPLALCLAACATPPPERPTSPTPRPAARILTIILTADPDTDTLTVNNIIRGPGSLRDDYPRRVQNPPANQLLFSFLGPEDRLIRQTVLPFPGPNRYEVPAEDGTIESITVPEADRVLLLRTNDSPALQKIAVSWTGRQDKRDFQEISLR